MARGSRGLRGASDNNGRTSGDNNLPINVASSGPSRTRSGTNTSSSNTSSSPNYMCNSSTADDAIGCDSCPRWFCLTTMCTCLKLETINLIASDADDGIL